VSTGMMFDVQVKRIHEYKRQLLNVLHAVHLYDRIRRGDGDELVPRMILIGGKAAPGYAMAKRIIRLITAVAEKINDDPDVRGRLTVAFFPNFSVKNGQWIYPAADLSEQISTAGMEASGTGNMKLTLNGALTLGTLDGANVEIREEVGAENFFLFGLTADEVAHLRRKGHWPAAAVERNTELRAVLDLLVSGDLARGDHEVFHPIVENLLLSDPFFVLADYAAYVACQDRVSEAWRDTERWTRMSILNTARAGKFSSDRAIREYCDEIWQVPPVKVTLD